MSVGRLPSGTVKHAYILPGLVAQHTRQHDNGAHKGQAVPDPEQKAGVVVKRVHEPGNTGGVDVTL